jgi:hypothetical protein
MLLALHTHLWLLETAQDVCCNCRYLAQTGVNEHARFILELEFIQCLANPHYLNCEPCLDVRLLV